MAVVNHVRKNVKMDLWSIVKFQLAVHCHLKALNVSDQDLSCLTFLALTGEKNLLNSVIMPLKIKFLVVVNRLGMQ